MRSYKIALLYLWGFVLLSLPVFSQTSTSKSEGQILFEQAIARIHTLDTAIRYFKQAIPHLKKEESWKNYVNTYNALHFCYFEKDDFESAQMYADIAFETAKQYLKRSDPPYSYALNNLGTIHTFRADYQQAIHYYEQALEIMLLADTQSAEKKAAIADAYSNIGTLLLKTGEYETAWEYLQQCLNLKIETLPKGEKDPFLAKTYRILADILLVQGDKQNALVYLNRITTLLTPPQNEDMKRQLVRHYYFLANLYLENEEINKAKRYLREIEQLSGELPTPHKLTNLKGKLALSQGEYDLARTLFQQILNQDTNNNLSVDEKAKMMEHMGDSWFEENQFQQAFMQYDLALKQLNANSTQDFFPFPLQHLNLQISKGKTLINLKNWKETIENTLQAAEIIQYLRQNYRALGPKLKLAQKAMTIYAQGITATYELYQKDQDPVLLETAFAFSELNKASILFESLMHTAATFQLSDNLRQKEHQLRIDLDFQAKLLYEKQQANSEYAQISRIQKRLFSLRKNYKKFIETLEVSYPTYFEEKYGQYTASISDVKALLNSKEMCLSYFWGKEYLYTFRITQGKAQLFRQIQQDSLIAAIHVYRKQLSQPPSSSQNPEIYFKYAWQLPQVLIPEFGGKAYEGIHRITVIPDGLVSYLPFESFLTQAPNLNKTMRYQTLPYLVRKYSFSYQYSAKLWLQMRQFESKSNKRLWAGFAPSYSPTQLNALNKQTNAAQLALRDENGLLPFALEEVQQIADLLKGKTFLYEAASEDRFKDQANAFSIIHLATHGLINEEKPLYNQLLFSHSADTLQEDGFLEAYELYNMNLQADMVVLSACNTGIGKIQNGEGIMSMARAFAAAGCQSLLLSLWQVSDKSTAELMLHFYKNLLDEKEKDIALQYAQLQYLEGQEESLYAHPYFWAGFVPVGNMEAMQFGIDYMKWLLILIFIGISVGGYCYVVK